MDWSLLAIPLAGGVRSVAGWIEVSLKDGKIDKYEWGKLISTIIEVGIISISAMYGLGTDATQSAGIGVLASFILSAVKKAGTKK
jgi:hypothetical protein